MKYKTFAVFDSKAGVFSHQWNSHNAATAVRRFAEDVNNEQHPVAKHPEDFTLFEIGEYDEEKGLMTSLATPHSLGLASEHVNR